MSNSTKSNEMLLRENAHLQQALNASELRFNQLTAQLSQASSFNDGIWDWDLVTDNVYLSPRWKEMLGYSDDELPNALITWESLLHPDDIEPSMQNIKNYIESDALFYESIHRLKRKDNSWIWVLARGIIIRNAQGKALRISGSHTDITLLRKTEEALLQRERELNNIVTISPDGIVTFTGENILSSVNPSFLNMTGFEQDELLFITKEQFDQKMMAVSDTTKPYRLDITNDESVLIQLVPSKDDASKHIQASQDDFKFNFTNQKSLYRVLRLTKYCLSNAITPTIMYFRDVTLETEMDRMKSEFLSVAAHELRMPISSIYGYSELLLHRDFDDMTKRDILQAIHGQCSSVVEMINDLLDLARIETRSQKFFHFKLQPLSIVIRETLSSFKMHGDFRKIEVHYFVDESALIYADSDQIKRALLNVLSNAFKYSPHGQNVVLHIKQRFSQKGVEEIGVIIEDKGIGMTAEQTTQIFDRFWRADNVRDIIGTGLGMALVKEIVDLHHGEVDVQSVLGQGTKIGLWFPITHSEEKTQND